MSEEMNSKGDGKEWFAKLVKEETKCIDVEITPPCKCIIGEWQFSIHTESKLKKDDIPLIFVYKHNEDINILLNPWCKGKLFKLDILTQYLVTMADPEGVSGSALLRFSRKFFIFAV